MNIRHKIPPRFAEWLLKKIANKNESAAIIGDMAEEYNDNAKNRGVFAANFRYWHLIIISLPSFFYNQIYWSLTMLKNYFKITLRNIMKHKGYSFINIAGLAIGLTCVILIILFVSDELSFDKYHDKASQIYRLERKGKFQGRNYRVPITAHPMGPTLANDFPEINQSVRFLRTGLMTKDFNNKYNEELIFFADENLFDMFSFKLQKGDHKSALSQPNSIVLTESMAKRYLNEPHPLGKTITLKWGEKNLDFKISGILKEIPKNSHFRTSFFASYSSLTPLIGKENMNLWIANSIFTYLELKEGTDIKGLENKFHPFIEKYMKQTIQQFLGPNVILKEMINLKLRPMTDIYLHSGLEFEIATVSDITRVYIFSAIALLVLIIACINFMNLSTARSAGRAKEVGLRKVVGASRKSMIEQFLGESVFLALIALILAIFMVELLLPTFNSFTQKELSIGYFSNPLLILSILCIAIAVGILSGLYPAFFLSSFKPTQVLKAAQRTGTGGRSPLLRKILVVFQFSISIILIIGTVIVIEQMDFLRNKKMGFNKEQVMVVNSEDNKLREKFAEIKADLKQNRNIKDIATSSQIPGDRIYSDTIFNREGKSEKEVTLMIYFAIDEDFVPAYDMELVAGRNLSTDFITDRTEGYLINETGYKKLGFTSAEEAIGKQLAMVTGQNTSRKGKIIGVIKDFNFKSLHLGIEPLALFVQTQSHNYISIRLKGNDIPGTIEYIKGKFKQFSPNYTFDYFFLDENFDRLYRAEQRMMNIIGYFTILAIFIACLGLFGLSSFTTEQRTKEIGIRKVLGASTSSITTLLTKSFIKWVLIASIIALPVAYFVMQKWLENFAYRTNIGIWPFFMSVVLALIIAIITISFQTIKAATSNPVDTMKYE